MSNRIEVKSRLIVDGSPIQVSLINTPTIEDVLVAEAQVQASIVQSETFNVGGRRVDRRIREFLIRNGVEI